MDTNIKLVLRKPPSINHIYAYTSRGGYAHSYITSEGKTWFEEGIYKAKVQSSGVRFDRTKLRLEIHLFTSREIQDIDNINKPLLDLLQKSEIIDNDKYIYELHSYKEICTKESERVELILSPIIS